MRRWMPAMDLVETDEHFVLRADLPGLTEEDVKIELEDGTLTVSGERKAEHETQERGLLPRRARVRRLLALADPAARASTPRPSPPSFDRGVLEVRDPEARGAQAAPRSRSAAPSAARRIEG